MEWVAETAVASEVHVKGLGRPGWSQMAVYGQVAHPPTRRRLPFVFVPLKGSSLSVTREMRLLISEGFAKHSHVEKRRLQPPNLKA